MNTLKLQYIGMQEFPGEAPFALLNVLCNGHPLNKSTRTIPGLIDAHIISAADADTLKDSIDKGLIRIKQEVFPNGQF